MAKQERRRAIERLEQRHVLTQFGVPWPAPQQLSFSFVPDGTLVAGNQPSDLFSLLNDASGAGDWQAAVMQALQTWAANANVNFVMVPDGGEPLGAPGLAQADSRFGDIRFAAAPLSPDVLALGTPFSPAAGTLAGDIVLNSNYQFGEGSNAQYDVFSVALHEVGHVLGVPDSTDPSSAMYSQYLGVRGGLTPADVAAVDAVFGVRPLDTSNQTIASPTLLSVRGVSNVAVVDAQLAAATDTHFYQYPVVDGEYATIVLHTAGVSLVEPQLTVYDGLGNVVGTAVSSGPNGADLVVHVHNPTGNPRLLIDVSSATGSVFGAGAYRLVVASGSYVPTNLLKAPPGNAHSDGGEIDDSGGGGGTYVGGEVDDGGEQGRTAKYSYSLQSILASPADVRYAHFTVPAAIGSGPLTLTATVWASQSGAASPVVSVYDGGGTLVPSEVLENENGTYSLQIVGVVPGAVYTVAVAAANPAGSTAVGSYHLAVNFGAAAAVLTPYASGTLTAAASQDFQVLNVNSSQYFHFLFSATSAATSGASVAVRMTIYDALGNVVQSLVDQAGSAVSTTLLLEPGTYLFRFAAGMQGNGMLADTNYQLQGTPLSDPIGPLPIKPITNLPPPPPPPFVFSSPVIPFYLVFLSLNDQYGKP